MSSNRPKLDSQAYITLAYLCTVAVGMMFDYRYYQHFEINIFEYADILDFLLAPVKNLELIAFAIGTVVIVWFFFWLDKGMEKRWPKFHRRINFGMSPETNKRNRPYIFAFSLTMYFIIASTFYGDRTFARFEESAKLIEVVYESNQRVIKGELIGKNSDYIFLQTADKVIKAIPVASDVQEIIISRPAPATPADEN